MQTTVLSEALVVKRESIQSLDLEAALSNVKLISRLLFQDSVPEQTNVPSLMVLEG